jgi:hypothetical protein
VHLVVVVVVVIIVLVVCHLGEAETGVQVLAAERRHLPRHVAVTVIFGKGPCNKK